MLLARFLAGILGGGYRVIEFMSKWLGFPFSISVICVIGSVLIKLVPVMYIIVGDVILIFTYWAVTDRRP